MVLSVRQGSGLCRGCLSVCLSGNKGPTCITLLENPHPVLLQLLRLTNIALSFIFFSFPLSVRLLFPFFSFYFFSFFFSASALYYINFNSLLPCHEIFLFLCKKKGKKCKKKKNNPNSPQSSPKASFFLKN